MGDRLVLEVKYALAHLILTTTQGHTLMSHFPDEKILGDPQGPEVVYPRSHSQRGHKDLNPNVSNRSLSCAQALATPPQGCTWLGRATIQLPAGRTPGSGLGLGL